MVILKEITTEIYVDNESPVVVELGGSEKTSLQNALPAGSDQREDLVQREIGRGGGAPRGRPMPAPPAVPAAPRGR